jgi:hypothetical protein
MSQDDEHWWSPDLGVGEAVLRKGKFYCASGDVFEESAFIRWVPLDTPIKVNYADWTDEERAKVKARLVRAKKKADAEFKVLLVRGFDLFGLFLQAKRKLVESARKKLTAEEFHAMLMEGRNS